MSPSGISKNPYSLTEQYVRSLPSTSAFYQCGIRERLGIYLSLSYFTFLLNVLLTTRTVAAAENQMEAQPYLSETPSSQILLVLTSTSPLGFSLKPNKIWSKHGTFWAQLMCYNLPRTEIGEWVNEQIVKIAKSAAYPQKQKRKYSKHEKKNICNLFKNVQNNVAKYFIKWGPWYSLSLIMFSQTFHYQTR